METISRKRRKQPGSREITADPAGSRRPAGRNERLTKGSRRPARGDEHSQRLTKGSPEAEYMMNTGVLTAELFLQDTAAGIWFGILAFVFGTVFGSFINCLAWRLVHGESILHGRSHCAECGHVLGPADLVPVFSWLFLRGRCRYCGEKISPRYMAAELVEGTGFLLCYLRWGLSADTLRWMAMLVVLLGLSLVDLEICEIPNRFLLAALIIWALTVPFVQAGTAVSAPADAPVLSSVIHSLLGAAAVGGGMLVISLLFDRVTGKESLGGGDVKLFFVAGLFLGAAEGLLCIILSCLIGLLFAGLFRKQKIPFGPAISIAMFLCALFGSRIVEWYLSLF